MVRLVIILEGGLIQSIFADKKAEATVLVCDYDVEGADQEDLMEAPAGDMGFHQKWDPVVEWGLVDAWFARQEKKLWEEERRVKVGIDGNSLRDEVKDAISGRLQSHFKIHGDEVDAELVGSLADEIFSALNISDAKQDKPV